MVSLSGIDVREIDLKSKTILLGSVPTDLGLGAVPEGMKRWVTFLKYTNKYKGENTAFLCSGASVLNAASSIAKDEQSFGRQYDTIGFPETPSPLFSIAETKYLTAFSQKGKVRLFIQYYDE